MTGLADVYFERGVSQGLEQGLEQGRLGERISMLLRFNVPEEDIINEITKEFGLKEEEVKELIKTNHENS